MTTPAWAGGSSLRTHQSYWLQAGPGAFPQTATFVDNPDLDFIEADVATGFERGATLAAWLLKVGAATTPGTIDIGAAQHSVAGVNAALATRWIYKDITGSDAPSIQLFSFTTPLAVPAAQRCGRFVFSDIHASSADRSNPNTPFPSGCATTALSPQEKVLAFMLFDIGSCVGRSLEIAIIVCDPSTSLFDTRLRLAGGIMARTDWQDGNHHGRCRRRRPGRGPPLCGGGRPAAAGRPRTVRRSTRRWPRSAARRPLTSAMSRGRRMPRVTCGAPWPRLAVSTCWCRTPGSSAYRTAHHYPVDVFARVMTVNVTGVFLTLKHGMPALAARGGGSV